MLSQPEMEMDMEMEMQTPDRLVSPESDSPQEHIPSETGYFAEQPPSSPMSEQNNANVDYHRAPIERHRLPSAAPKMADADSPESVDEFSRIPDSLLKALSVLHEQYPDDQFGHSFEAGNIQILCYDCPSKNFVPSDDLVPIVFLLHLEGMLHTDAVMARLQNEGKEPNLTPEVQNRAELANNLRNAVVAHAEEVEAAKALKAEKKLAKPPKTERTSTTTPKSKLKAPTPLKTILKAESLEPETPTISKKPIKTFKPLKPLIQMKVPQVEKPQDAGANPLKRCRMELPELYSNASMDSQVFKNVSTWQSRLLLSSSSIKKEISSFPWKKDNVPGEALTAREDSQDMEARFKSLEVMVLQQAGEIEKLRIEVKEARAKKVDVERDSILGGLLARVSTLEERFQKSSAKDLDDQMMQHVLGMADSDPDFKVILEQISRGQATPDEERQFGNYCDAVKRELLQSQQ